MGNKLTFHRLTSEFFVDNPSLKEILEPDTANKIRPYGYISVKVKGNNFAIPIRTRLPHKTGFITATNTIVGSRGFNSGLDYTKAVLVNDARYLGITFKIKPAEYKKVRKNQNRIISEFTSFVEDYLIFKGHKFGEYQFVKDPETAFRYCTLVNYHAELGIVSSIYPIRRKK